MDKALPSQSLILKLPEFAQIVNDPIKRQAKYSAKTSSCLVCGDKARIMNYGALSCASCKTFFRRHGFRIEDVDPCQFNGACQMAKESRRVCSACRLAKCLAVGMSRDLIRKEDLSDRHQSSTNNYQYRQNASRQNRTFLYPVQTLDLLNKDRSSLKTTDWTLFSNILHAFDTLSPIKSIHDEITLQSKLPSKIRLKLANELIPKLLSSFYTSLKSFVTCTNEFRRFSTAEQHSICQRNFHTTSSFMGQLILRESGIFDDATYLSGFTSIYDVDTLIQAASIMQRLDNDSTLVKVFLVIVSFSSNCFLVENSIDIHDDLMLHKTRYLFLYQNLYAELLWKYMMFRYGYKEAACRFAKLTKHIVDLIPLTIHTYLQNQKHLALIHEIHGKNQCSLSGESREQTVNGVEQ